MTDTPAALTGAPDDQQDLDALTWKPLRLLSFYRTILAGLLSVLFFTVGDQTSLGSSDPQLYGITCLAYLAFSLLAGTQARLRRPGYQLQAITQLLVDIAAILVLIYSSGGLSSGLGMLLIISVATGCILLPDRLALFSAAIAALALMGEQLYQYFYQNDQRPDGFTQAGMLGLGLFATAVLTSLLVRRIRASEELARRRGIDLANLANLNVHIVQRMQAGIIVTDHSYMVRLMNDAAHKLLDYRYVAESQSLENISPALYTQLLAWRKHPEREPELLKGGKGNLLPHFTLMGTADGLGAMILLEDTAAMEKQAQQIKLASLGRLTASIAHEIRNPLGAISHASQLLNEDNTLDSADHRLMAIISDNTARVNAIVENILQLSRPGMAVPQNLRIGEWLERFVDEFTHSGNIQPHQVSLTVTPAELEIQIDPSQLHQVVWNLCQNSIHHAGPGPANEVQITLSAATSVGSRAPHLDIIDNGPGINPDMADQIFEPFFTTHSSGTGLGLYIAREICASNQATLAYRPADDGGSCFRITFPTGKRRSAASFALPRKP
jgi:two-component system sensor histidine kinase PilS (NtrC family)